MINKSLKRVINKADCVCTLEEFIEILYSEKYVGSTDEGYAILENMGYYFNDNPSRKALKEKVIFVKNKVINSVYGKNTFDIPYITYSGYGKIIEKIQNNEK